MRTLALSAIITAVGLASATAGPGEAAVTAASNLTVLATPPAAVGANFILDAGLPERLIFNEAQGVTLASALTTDTGMIAAGTRVDSHFFAANAASDTRADSWAQFSGAVLGVIYFSNSANFAASDFLGAAGTAYSEGGHTGFEPGDDAVVISGYRVDFHTFYSTPGDFARVITASPSGTLEPATWSLLLLGFFGVGATWRRRRALA